MPGPYAVRVKTVDGWQDLAMLGPAGPTGPTGPGVPVGGTTGQVLAKKSATDLDTQWVAQSGGSGAGGHTIQDEGVSLTARTKMNFVGGGVTATDDSANDRTVITVPAVDVAAGRQTANGATTDIAGSWKAIPIGTFLSEAADAFTISANSVTVKDAGWYHVSASLLSPQGATASTFLSLSTSTSAGDGDIANSAGATIYSRSSASGSVKLAAGAKVYVYGWSNGASPTNVNLVAFSIEKIGGPKGEKGDTGGNATVPFDNLHVIGAAGEIAFGTGWGAWSQCAFRKDPLGKVMFRGTMKSTANFSFGAASATLFTLPVGYRPADNISQKVVVFEPDGATTSMSLCTVLIATSGAVTIQGRIAGVTTSGLSGSYVWLHELDFDTETVTAMPTGPVGPAGPTGPTPSESYVVATGGASVTCTANTQVTLPLPATFTQSSTPAPFTRNADGTMTCAITGQYSLAFNAALNTSLAAGLRCQFAIFIDGVLAGLDSGYSPWASGSAVYNGLISVGQIIRFAAFCDVTQDGRMISGSAHRFGGPKGDTGATGGNATVPIDPWHTVGAVSQPAFTNSWAGTIRFRKDPLGRVWVQGTISAGASGTVAFTLPAGYRPTAQFVTHSLQDNDIAGTWVYVNTDGTLVPARSQASCFIDLSFDTETVTAMPTGPQGPAGPSTPILVVTSLPVAPVDGQEVYLQSAAMATLGLLWRLRYNAASSSSYKWEFLGGSDWSVEGIGGRDWNGTGQTVTSTGVVDLPDGLGPSISVPVSGIYDVSGLAMGVMQGGAPGLQVWVTGDAAVSWPNVDALFYGSATTGTGAPLSVRRQRTIPAGSAVSLRYTTSNATGGSKFYNRNLYLRPVRVG